MNKDGVIHPLYVFYVWVDVGRIPILWLAEHVANTAGSVLRSRK